MTVATSRELFGGEELAAAGEVISAVTLDSNVVIHVGVHRDHEFRIENEFTVQTIDGDTSFVVSYDPYNKSAPVRRNLTEFSAVVAKTLTHARAFVDGVLELTLSDQTIITVQPQDKYEAWTYTFGSYILACPPGGFSAS